jgi:hypothetical protein
LDVARLLLRRPAKLSRLPVHWLREDQPFEDHDPRHLMTGLALSTTVLAGVLACLRWAGKRQFLPNFGTAMAARRADEQGLQVGKPQARWPAVRVHRNRIRTLVVAAKNMQVAQAGLSQLARGALTVNIFCCDVSYIDGSPA